MDFEFARAQGPSTQQCHPLEGGIDGPPSRRPEPVWVARRRRAPFGTGELPQDTEDIKPPQRTDGALDGYSPEQPAQPPTAPTDGIHETVVERMARSLAARL